ncbi:hypothetical protein UUU_40390 [Klebsiella pneumoniae subsp. pneumoniae DSM 30104 = JCM 1662 = NBRC 14940]|nr:hypothetical protein UUU_40390 [Klebsiella pneumoniae subsp. pneumoniae DSM 30104 = JCM 1662 = NBRC 14940]
MRRHYWRRGIIHKAYSLCGLSTVDKPPKNFQIINHPLNTANAHGARRAGQSRRRQNAVPRPYHLSAPQSPGSRHD